MAYMNQEKKNQKAPQIKAVLKKYGMKGSIAVKNHSTLVVNIREGRLDVIGNYIETSKPEHDARDYLRVNEYHIENHYSGDVLAFLTELHDAMNAGNHDRSEPMTDYFDVGFYIEINIGQFQKPFKLAA